jgi:TP901 family phage tail tape measure protein
MPEKVLNIGVVYNNKNLNQAAGQAEQVFKELRKPVPIDFGNISQATNRGEAEKVLLALQAQANELTKVTAKEATYRNETGETYTKLISMSTTYRNSVGDTANKISYLGSNLEKVRDGFALDEAVDVQIKIGAATDGANKLLQVQIDKVKKIGEQGQALADKSSTWGKAKKQQMEDLNAKLQEQIAKYNQLSVSTNKVGIGALGREISKTKSEMDALKATTVGVSGAFSSLGTHLMNAIKQTISYSITIMAVRQAQKLLNEALRYTIDLNKEMTNIQVLQAEGAKTPDQIRDLASSYNELAQSMGTTTLEIARGSVEWLRQGKTISETTELMKASTMLSKLGAMSAADATEDLTSTLNSYKMATEDAVAVVDKLIAVDNVSATSAGELAQALRYVAAQAAETGVSLDQLISYIAVISSTTRLNAEQIGQAMKTMFTRMQDIKAGAIDEDGLGINNVAIALERVDVPLMKSATEFRDLGDVLEELSGKWDTLNDIEQANIGKAIAGVRQVNMFKVLMQNMGDATELQGVQAGAAGLAWDRYKLYLESVEAAQNKLKAAFEGLVMSFGKLDKVIIWFINLGTSAIKTVDKLGGLPTVIIMITAAMIALNRTNMISFFTNLVGPIGKTITSLKMTAAWVRAVGLQATLAAGEMTGLKVAMAETGFGAIILLVGALVSWLVKLSHAAEDAAEKANELRGSLKETSDELQTAFSKGETITDLWSKLDALNSKMKSVGDVTSLTTEQQKEYYEIQSQLATLMPGALSYYDEEGRLILDSSVSLQTLLDLRKEEITLLREKVALEAAASARAERDNIVAQTQAVKDATKALEIFNRTKEEEAAAYFSTEVFTKAYWDEVGKTEEELTQAQGEAMSAKNFALLGLKESYAALGEEARASFIESLKSSEDTAYLADILTTTIKDAAGEIEPVKIPANIDLKTEDFLIKIDEIKKKFADLDTIIAGALKGENVSEFTKKLDDLGIQWALLDGKIVISTSSLDAYKQKEIETATAGYDLTSSQIAGFNALTASTEQTLFGVTLTASAYQTAAGDISSSLFTAAQNSGIALYDIAGNALTSAENVKIAMLDDVQNFTLLVNQMVSAGKLSLSDFMSYLNQLLAFTTGASIYTPTTPTFVSPSGGGGGENVEKERIEAQIRALEDEKDALKDRLNEFNRYIDAQKESLKLQKEEADFTKELEKKNKSLAKLKTEIALLALDTSEEARAKRLELEEQAGELETDITEDTEDRKYDLQMQALDDLQQQFEDNINAQIDGLDDTIEEYREQSAAIQESTASVQGGTVAVQQNTGAMQDLMLMTEEAGRTIMEAFTAQFELSKMEQDALQKEIDKWIEKGLTIREATQLALDFVSATNLAMIYQDALIERQHDFRNFANQQGDNFHSGGIVESHHNGDAAGGLASNEVFAKLLKGEVVVNEDQANRFMKETLPRMAGMPSVAKGGGGSGGDSIEISMPISVAGNLDKSVIPELREMVTKVINDANKARGTKRTVNSYSI